MKEKNLQIIVLFLVMIMISACTATNQGTGDPTTRILNVMTHDSFSVSDDLITQFELENNVKINFLLSGDTGAALNRAILTKESPQADVFFGVDNTFISRALEEKIFEPYDSPMLQTIDEMFKMGTNFVLPVDYGDVCINYDKSFFEEHELSVPATFSDLLKPEYKGLLVVENPATSSPGLAFMLATIAEFGEEEYLDFWVGLKNNGVVIVNDWETAYYTNFSASSGNGPQPMVVSYGSSPPAEVIYAESELSEAPTASIVTKNMCFRQIEYVGILNGTKERELAEKFIDFMLDTPFQEDMPLQMFVFPVNSNATLPVEFIEYAQISQEPASLDPELIANNRDKWIQDWTLAVLR